MSFDNYIRGIVHNHKEIKNKLKKASSKQTPFQYVYQTLVMTGLSTSAILFLTIMFTKSNLTNMLIGITICIILIPFIYNFFFSYVDVLIRKQSRELDADLLFISEYFLVSLESGLPLGNAIQSLSKLKRPGAKFFKKIFTEFNTGKDLEQALDEGSQNCASDSMKVLLKRLKDSLNIGIDLKVVLENFIEESAEKKIIEIRSFSKKLNPLVMMYLLLGVVIPSLGVTFFMLGATFMNITSGGLKLILFTIFLVMLLFQYMSYSGFKFSKATL